MDKGEKRTLKANLTPAGALAFAIGTALGWGSLVVTGSSYLAQSGIAGSVIGMVLGMIVMLVIARNYSYMMQIHPDAGGAYAFSREEFGHDYGFLTAWFLSLIYLSVLWANATSIPLFTRYFIGPVLQFGKLYTLFGYDIYVGEVLITIAVILLTAVLCIMSKTATASVMTLLVGVFILCITIVSVAALVMRQGVTGFSWEPSYVPETGELSQMVRIAVISPWAFVGFESISHRTEEFSFKRNRIFGILVAAVVITTLLYILLILLSVTAYPERYATWLDYIRDRGNLEGLEALPAFYAAKYYMGSAGVRLMMAALLALVITSLIGNTTALSRLFYALAKDRLLPEKYSEIDSHGTPGKAIMLIALVSCVIPFVGRTAIGWIVDVTTLGATLIYGLVSAAASKRAAVRGDKVERFTGIAGIVIMTGYALYTLLPDLVAEGSIERETFMLFVVWSILGSIYFRVLLNRDKEKKYGKSIIVWLALISLIFFITMVWMRQSMIASNREMTENVRSYYEQLDDSERDVDESYVLEQINSMNSADDRTIIVSIGMMALALVIMFSNNAFMNRRAQESENMVNRDPMTGVKSRHAYLNKCREMDEAIAAGTSAPFAVAVCDVNGLKHINDTLGHKAGDEYICEASRLICRIFQHSPVFRLGGDEFAVIMSGSDHENRAELMKTLHDRSAENIPEGRAVVAGGCADYEADKDGDVHSVFERADQLMYKEKQALKGLGALTRDD